uniref:Hemolytic lectin-L1 n=1 Tax=Pseudocnus echinatus TaxID=2592315 RepID=F2ZBT6_PSEEC|nr:hemolytic lectin-L1 [Cucumaria echinata]
MEHIRVLFSLNKTLCFIFMVSLVPCGFAQVLCTNPLNIGELRSFKSKQCVDIVGNQGSGNIATHDCDGLSDQQIIICGDGTIRNEARNYCFTPDGSGNANVMSSSCTLYPEIPSSQRWRQGRRKTFTDNGGIEQVATEIINLASGKCLDIEGNDGTGDIGVYNCDSLDDQYFYVRSRGPELFYGRLRNEKSDLCLDVEGSDGKGNVLMYSCEDYLDQWFRYYENGEIVNAKSGMCLDVEGSDGSGNVGIYRCDDLRDQMWSRPNAYCNGDYCSFLNKESNKCLDVSGDQGTGDVGTWQCDGLPDQRFKWVFDDWEVPTATWNMVGCNQNGKVSQQISNTISFSSTVTAGVAVEVSSTIEKGVIFAKASVSVKVTASLSKAWTNSQSGTTAITYTCDNYDSDEEFTRGCMWQLAIETTEVKSGDLLVWNPQIVKCTRSNTAPGCAPFTKCANEDCTFCTDI